MAAVKSILYIFFLLGIVITALLFSFRNETIVDVDFILFHSSSLSLGFWIIASFILGSILGWVISFPGWLRLKLSSTKRDRQLKNSEDELLRLKGDSAK